MLVNNRPVSISRKKLGMICKNPSTKEEIESYLGIRCRSLYNSLMSQKVTYNDYLLFLILEKDIMRKGPAIIDSVKCGVGNEMYKSTEKKEFGKLQLNANSLLRSLIELVSYEDTNKQKQAIDYFVNSIYPNSGMNLNPNNPIVKEKFNQIKAFILKIKKIQSGDSGIEDIRKLNVLIDSIDTESEFVRSIFSKQQLEDTIKIQSLSESERNDIFRRVDEKATPATGAVAATAGVVVATALVASSADIVRKTMSDYCDIKTRNIFYSDSYFDLVNDSEFQLLNAN